MYKMLFNNLVLLSMIGVCSVAQAEEEGNWSRAGQEIGEAASAVGHATADTAEEVWDATKQGSKKAWKATKEVSGEAWDATREAAHDGVKYVEEKLQ